MAMLLAAVVQVAEGQNGARLGSDRFDAIVRVEVSALVPDYRTPWNAGSPAGGSGSGFFIGDKRFLTNAHVVSNATRVLVRRLNDPSPHFARVVHVAHDCDLAMVELVDGKAFEDVEALELGGIPGLDSEVLAVGYPIGGERLSVTRGVVSRIDFQSYSHSAVDQHLAIQIDAAINPGNSGGPVLQDGKVVGVAFQGFTGAVAQNVGYMIPTPVVERFLKDVEDGSYDRYVDLAISEFPIQNPAQRRALGLEDDGVGVYVARVNAAGSAAGVIEEGDVLLSIDGNPVLNNGLIRLDGELVNLNEVVERMFADDEVKVELWRGGELVERVVTLKPFEPYLINANQYDVRPQYTVVAGLLFQPLDRNLVAAHGLSSPTVRHWFDNFVGDDLYLERRQPVILTTILPDEINSGIQGFDKSLVDSINGVLVTDLATAHRALWDEGGDTDGFLVVRLVDQERPLVIERARLGAAQERIKRLYGIGEESYLGEESVGEAAIEIGG